MEFSVDNKSIRKKLVDIAEKYPSNLRNYAVIDIDRTLCNISLTLKVLGKPIEEASIVDLGGNISMFSLCCKAIGFRDVCVIDDFSDPINDSEGDSILDLHRSHGINIVNEDLVKETPHTLPSADVYTSFDSMEHWHHSPKNLFATISSNLKVTKGGFVLGVPNCVNMRKRITVPFGYGKWSQMVHWYEVEQFRGHVREPDVSDLKYIARDIGFDSFEIVGRNWVGLKNGNCSIRALSKIVDLPMRLLPSICGDIDLVTKMQ